MNIRGIFKKARKVPSANPDMRPEFQANGSPQYFVGVEPAGSAKQSGFRPGSYNAGMNFVRPTHPAVVTPGFDDSHCQDWALHYTERQQPDRGGALNFSYDLYGLPLVQPSGAFMTARTPFMPIGSVPMQQWPVSVPTGAGLFPGQVISQPLLNPQGPSDGYDIYS
jgi:hypothetical protein